MNRKQWGRIGEDMAEEYLRGQGYEIVEKNFSCSFGEIDIIARKNRSLIFIEVKYRKSENYGSPLQAVDSRKISRLKRIIEYYCLIRKIKDCPLRIEVIGILKDKEKFSIEHIKEVL